MPLTAMHETSVRATVPLEGYGNCVICGLPGLVINHDGTSYLDPEHSDLTFEYLAAQGVVRLYLLMEDMELPPKTRSVVAISAKDAGIALLWMPIVDFGKPDEAFEDVWKADRDSRMQILQNKDSIGVACLYGAGRSGMMSAAIAAECGIEVHKAVRYVRPFYGDAVASPNQEKWVASGRYLA